MDDILVGRVMTSEAITVHPDTFVEEAASLLLENDIGSLIVVDDDGRLEGILTTTDFVHIVAASKPKAKTTVERYMSTDVTTASAQDAITDVADVMIAEGIHHLPVIDDEGNVIGVVSTTDLTEYISGLKPRRTA
ncbi:CBS domain-containing protein [Halopenitus malekzadehii]|uniref:CBS domain-containing protein n=1 Tax=Halopenitus malekzadehii TaxID=1267564 RepID=A0A1H6I369_9EURY|nr:CBS domain-containing protein [Halopenitus malekzadehii]SEH40892.1 CBS domain-containing protein [Halopenitus malekzadehii]